jgi:hypothetical protein
MKFIKFKFICINFETENTKNEKIHLYLYEE